jgi:transposase
LLKELRLDPLRSQQQLCAALRHYGIFVDRDHVQRACQRLGVSYKGVSPKHELKFSMDNIMYYLDS